MKTKELEVFCSKTIICPFCLYQFSDPTELIDGLEADRVAVECDSCSATFLVNKRVTFSYTSFAPLDNLTNVFGTKDTYVLSDDMRVIIDHSREWCTGEFVPLSLEMETKCQEARQSGMRAWVDTELIL